jgi:DNA primase
MVCITRSYCGSMSVVDEIKDRIDTVEVIGETVKLRKSGKNYTGFCPFHPNTRTPAFVVFPESGTWRCFGACNEGGDVFSFLMKKEGWDFPETLRYLAERAGVTLKPRTSEQAEAEETGQRLRDLLEATIPFYRHHLLQTPAGAAVLEYLHPRSISARRVLMTRRSPKQGCPAKEKAAVLTIDFAIAS